MSLPKIDITGDYTMYVGDADLSSTLILMTAEQTGGKKLSSPVKRNFEQALGRSQQSDLALVRYQISFLELDDMVLKIQNGQALTDTQTWGVTTFAQYSLLFLHPDDTAKLSVWIPRAEVESDPELDESKEHPTLANIVFKWQVRNRHVPFRNMDTPAALKANHADLATRSPY